MSNNIDLGVPRVLHVITPSRMAGAETFLARLIRRTPADEIAYHCISDPGRANLELLAAGLSFEPLAIGGKANLLAVPRIRRAAREFRANLLHSHLSTASWWCGWLERFGGPPSIGHVHGFTSALWHRGQSQLIACSAAVKADLIEKGFDSDRITVMHYPVDPADQQAARSRAAVRAELGVADDTPVVGTFAHLSIKKGYRELVQAAELVLNHVPNAQFWCVGEGGLHEELELAAQSAGIADRFRLLGFRRDVPDLMHAIDVMCLASHREPFGLVYVEAALAERPVIACDAGGAPEIITDGENGLLVPPPFDASLAAADASGSAGARNVPALANAILTMLDNRDQAATMGRRGRELALARFGWPRYLARLRELYDGVLGREARNPSTGVAQAA
jgi:glycosyltransferase involved in cell wall biosynthesis